MKILRLIALFTSLTVISFSAQAGESYNLTTEFSILNGNPNGVWTYGRYTNGLDKASFLAFVRNETGVLGRLDIWRDTTDPNVVKNTGETGELCCGITFHGGAVTFGPHSGPAVTRFTVPSTGDWMVDATFSGVQSINSPPTAWVHNGLSFDLVDQPVKIFPATSGYSQILTLSAGDTIDIVVGDGSKTTEVSATITKQSINVGIDIKPGSDPNSINLCSNGTVPNGTVPVAILGSETFNVYDIVTTTLMFADAGVKVVGKKDKELCSYENVDGDAFDDLVCHFVTMDISAIHGASISATVSGALSGGTEIEGTDSVNIVKDTCD